MGPTVQRGDVFRLDIPGDNGETKRRICIVLDLSPPGRPDAAIIIFGCSQTKVRTPPDAFVRVEQEHRTAFRALGLANPTSFHRDDIRVYDAASPMLAAERRAGRCPAPTMIALRALLEQRYRDARTIPVLPKQASEATRKAAAALTAGGGSSDA